MKFKAILFDMDGVIVNSETAHFDAYKIMLSRYGADLTWADYRDCFSGKSGLHGLKDFTAQHAPHLSPQAEDILQEKADWYLKNAANELTGYDDTLSFIKDSSVALPFALVTGSLKRVTDMTLQRFELEGVFKTVITANDIENGKPDPEGYLLAAANLDINPTLCVVIEDSPSGIAAAKRAGMYCIALTTTHSKNQLTEADVIVDTLTPDLFE